MQNAYSSPFMLAVIQHYREIVPRIPVCISEFVSLTLFRSWLLIFCYRIKDKSDLRPKHCTVTASKIMHCMHTYAARSSSICSLRNIDLHTHRVHVWVHHTQYLATMHAAARYSAMCIHVRCILHGLNLYVQYWTDSAITHHSDRSFGKPHMPKFKNRNVPFFRASKSSKTGQFRLNRNGWQVCLRRSELRRLRRPGCNISTGSWCRAQR